MAGCPLWYVDVRDLVTGQQGCVIDVTKHVGPKTMWARHDCIQSNGLSGCSCTLCSGRSFIRVGRIGDSDWDGVIGLESFCGLNRVELGWMKQEMGAQNPAAKVWGS